MLSRYRALSQLGKMVFASGMLCSLLLKHTGLLPLIFWWNTSSNHTDSHFQHHLWTKPSHVGLVAWTTYNLLGSWDAHQVTSTVESFMHDAPDVVLDCMLFYFCPGSTNDNNIIRGAFGLGLGSALCCQHSCQRCEAVDPGMVITYAYMVLSARIVRVATTAIPLSMISYI